MGPIKDIHGHIICMGDAASGLIETKYRHLLTTVVIPIGSTYTVVRDNVITHITRKDDTAFHVDSFIKQAE